MEWSRFSHSFHESWHSIMRPFIESKECDDIYAVLKKESSKGKKIAPLSQNTWRAFEYPLDKVRVVMLGMCPYHSTRDGIIIADGLLMGCSSTGILQPSLMNFYKGIEKELYNGLNLQSEFSADVSYLAEQGVLMLNAALTTEINIAGIHIKLWRPFTTYILEKLKYVPTIFLGQDAAKYSGIPEISYTLSHPAHASYISQDWDTQGVFGEVNTLLGTGIEWL